MPTAIGLVVTVVEGDQRHRDLQHPVRQVGQPVHGGIVVLHRLAD